MFGSNNRDLKEELKHLKSRVKETIERLEVQEKEELERLEVQEKEELERLEEQKKETIECFKKEYIKNVTDIEQGWCASLLSRLYRSTSQEKVLSLIDLFEVLADIRFELGVKTNNLKYYNDAAIRLQYMKYLIELNNLHIPSLDDSDNKDSKPVSSMDKSQNNNDPLLKSEDKILDSTDSPLKSKKTSSSHAYSTLGRDDEVSDNKYSKSVGNGKANSNNDLNLVSKWQKTDNTSLWSLEGCMNRLIEIHNAIIKSSPENITTYHSQNIISYQELQWLMISEQFSYKGLIELLREEMHTVASQPIPLIEAEKYCNKISDQLNNYLGLLFRDAELAIGPSPCKYAVISLGSMALKQTTPYSDLEFAIIIDNENTDDLFGSYFECLSHYVHFKVIMLGETSIPISDYNLSLDHLIKPGIQFDLGGKTPLGRTDKKYKLIGTVDGMLEYLKTGHDIDKFLPYILQCSSYVYGDEDIANKYITEVNEFLTKNGAERAYARLELGSEVFLGHLEALTLHAAEDSGKFVYVKDDIYRMADRFIYNLALIYAADVGEGSWKMIDELEYRKILLPSAADNLKKALSFVTILRIKIYDFYRCQSDKMDIRAVEQNDPTTSNIFHLTHELSEKLFEYYYIVFPLQDRLREFTAQYTQEKYYDSFFINCSSITSETFYRHDPHTEGKVFLRLLNYSEARKCFLKMRDVADVLENNYREIVVAEFQDYKVDAHQTSSHVLSALNSIGSWYHDLGLAHYYLRRFDVAKILFEKSRDLKNDPYDKIIDAARDAIKYPSKVKIPTKIVENILQLTISTLNHLGLTHIALEDYGSAFSTFYRAYELKYPIIEALGKISDGAIHKDFRKICNQDVSILTNLGTLYSIIGQKKYGDTKTTYLNKASYCFDLAKILMPELSPLDNAYHLIGLGKISYVKGKATGGRDFKAFVNIFTRDNHSLDVSEMKNALEKNHEALEMLCDVYAHHPIKARVLNNISVIYYQLGSYKKSLEIQKKSLAELDTIYSDDHYQVQNTIKRIKIIKKNAPHHKSFNEFSYFINKLQKLDLCFAMKTEGKVELIVKTAKILEGIYHHIDFAKEHASNLQLDCLSNETWDDWITTPLRRAVRALSNEAEGNSDGKCRLAICGYTKTKQEQPIETILNNYSKIYDVYINLFYAVNLLKTLANIDFDPLDLCNINNTLLGHVNKTLENVEEETQLTKKASIISLVTNIISKAHVINDYISKLNICATSETNILIDITKRLINSAYNDYDTIKKEKSVEVDTENNIEIIKDESQMSTGIVKDSDIKMISAQNIKMILDAIATLQRISIENSQSYVFNDNESSKIDVRTTGKDMAKLLKTEAKENDTKKTTTKLKELFKDEVDAILKQDSKCFYDLAQEKDNSLKKKSNVEKIRDVLGQQSSCTDLFYFFKTDSPILGKLDDFNIYDL